MTAKQKNAPPRKSATNRRGANNQTTQLLLARRFYNMNEKKQEIQNGANDETREILVAKINPLTTPITDHPAERKFCELVGRVFELLANGTVAPSDTGEIYITDKTIMRPIYQEIQEIEEFTAKKLTRDKLVKAILEQPSQLEKYEKTIDRLNNRIDELLADNKQRRQKFIDDLLGSNNSNFEPVKEFPYIQTYKRHVLPIAHDPISRMFYFEFDKIKLCEQLKTKYGDKFRTEVEDIDILNFDKFTPVHGLVLLCANVLVASNITVEEMNDENRLILALHNLAPTQEQLYRSLFNKGSNENTNFDDIQDTFDKVCEDLQNIKIKITLKRGDKPINRPLLPVQETYRRAKKDKKDGSPNYKKAYEFYDLPPLFDYAKTRHLISFYNNEIFNKLIKGETNGRRNNAQKNNVLFYYSLTLYALDFYETAAAVPNTTDNVNYRRRNYKKLYDDFNYQDKGYKARQRLRDGFMKVLEMLASEPNAELYHNTEIVDVKEYNTKKSPRRKVGIELELLPNTENSKCSKKYKRMKKSKKTPKKRQTNKCS